MAFTSKAGIGGLSPPSSNLLREIAKSTEQPRCAQAEVLGTDKPCREAKESQRRRAMEIPKNLKTLTTGQYYYITIIAPSGEQQNKYLLKFVLSHVA